MCLSVYFLFTFFLFQCSNYKLIVLCLGGETIGVYLLAVCIQCTQFWRVVLDLLAVSEVFGVAAVGNSKPPLCFLQDRAWVSAVNEGCL